MVLAEGGEDSFPPAPQRCPSCRLVVGADRAQRTPAAAAGERAHGSAANVLSSRARRADAAPGDPDEILEAIRAVARELGCPPQRLRMLDYAQVARATAGGAPTLGCVLATFGAWKTAARSAARTAPGPAAPVPAAA
jgi:hypothetical protein